MAYTLFYHTKCEGFYGRGYVAISMLKHTGTEFEVKGPEDVPAGVGFAVPMLTFPDGYSIAQTGAITVALGEAVGLAPASPAGKAKAMQLMDDGADINTEMGAGKPVERITKWMDHFETQLGDNEYFIDNKLSFADFHLFPLQLDRAQAGYRQVGGVQT